MGSQAITAGIFGVIVLVLAFILFTPIVSAIDGLILYWSDSCEYNNQRYVRAYYELPSGTDVGTSPSNIYVPSTQNFYGSGVNVVANGADCQVSAITATTFSPAPAATATINLVSERGVRVDSVTLASTAAAAHEPSVGTQVWTTVPTLLTQFGGIGKLILSVMPIVILVTYLGTAGMGLIEYGRGLSSGGIVNAVGGSVLSLIVQVVILQVMPTVLDAVVGAARITGGQYTVTQQFSSITSIVFAAIPILFVVALLGTSGFQFYKKASGFRGAMGM